MPNNTAKSFLEYLFHPEWSLPSSRENSKAVTAIVDIYEATGGATFSLSFGDQSQEPLYVVGLDNNLTKHPSPSDFDEEEVDNSLFLMRAVGHYLETHRSLLENSRCCIGLWSLADEEGQPKIFLDVSVLVYNKEIAYAFGREGNQIAIFSLQEGREIEIGGTGESTEARLRRLALQDRPVLAKGE